MAVHNEYKGKTLIVKENEERGYHLPMEGNNRKVLVIVMLLSKDKEGKAVYTEQEIADRVGLNDRRDVSNYWVEFVACGYDFRSL
jgi:hypothetical protein